MKNTNERTTIIKGQIIDTQKCTFEPFEVETSYTHSEIKAAKLAIEALNLDPKRYMVKVDEYINEKAQQVVYDAQSLCDFATEIGNYEDDFEPTETQKIIEFEAYIYSGQVWAVSGEDYTTEFYEVERNVKLTKVDQRATVAMCYEKENERWTVLGVHNVTRKTVKRYALIEVEALENVKTK